MGELSATSPSPTWLDGGLATTLQGWGLPPFTPVDGWLQSRPDAVVAAHRAFVEAGAEIVLAGTFRAWADPELAGLAIRLAREGAGDARVYASVCPGELDGILAFVAAHGASVDGIVLETWLDPLALEAAVRAVRAIHRGPLIASLVPTRGAALGPLVEAGADGVGFNCGAGPAAVADAILAVPDPGAPLWARPAGGPGVVEALLALAARCRWVGGCCGVTAEDLRAARARWAVA